MHHARLELMPNLDTQTVQLIIVGVTALALLVQTIVLLMILSVARKAAKSMREDVEDLRSSLLPIIFNTRDLLVRITPKLETTAEDFAQMAASLRDQTADVQQSAKVAMERMNRQFTRVDSMFTSTLDTVDRATSFVTGTVSKQVRQLSAVLASAKAIIESLRSPEPPAPRASRPVPGPVHGDDNFI